MGLALADEAWRKGRGRFAADGVPSFNLLPARYLPRPLPIRPVTVFLALLLLGVVALDAGGRVDILSTEVATLSANLVEIQDQERQQRLALNATRGIEKDIAAIDLLIQRLEPNVTNLANELEITLERLETITEIALAPNFSLASFVQQGEDFALNGTASSYEDVLGYMENLRASGLFSGVRLQQVTASPEGVSFQAKVLVPSTQDGELQ